MGKPPRSAGAPVGSLRVSLLVCGTWLKRGCFNYRLFSTRCSHTPYSDSETVHVATYPNLVRYFRSSVKLMVPSRKCGLSLDAVLHHHLPGPPTSPLYTKNLIRIPARAARVYSTRHRCQPRLASVSPLSPRKTLRLMTVAHWASTLISSHLISSSHPDFSPTTLSSGPCWPLFFTSISESTLYENAEYSFN